MEHKKQHWVPRSYLAAWCDPETPQGHAPYVWQFPKDGGEGRRRAPKNIFWETDMYTIHLPAGERDLTLEHGLKGLEDGFVRVREKIFRRELLTHEERVLLCAFMAAMHVRSRVHRDHLREEWGRVLLGMQAWTESFDRMTPEERQKLPNLISDPNAPTLSINDIEQMAERPMQVALVPMIEVELQFMAQMNLTILHTSMDPGFITSDAPCVFFDPDVHRRPFPLNSIGFLYRSLEVTMALSPQFAALLSWQDVPAWVEVGEKGLDEINRRSRFTSQEHFIVTRNMVNPYWFDPRLDLRPVVEKGPTDS